MMSKKKKKKVSARRQHVRNSMSAERMDRLSRISSSGYPLAILFWVVFVAAVITLLSVNSTAGRFFEPGQPFFKPWPEIVASGVIVVFVAAAAGLYVHHYEGRIVHRPMRILAMEGLFLILLLLTKIGGIYPEWMYLATGSAVTSAIILTIAYNQRFAMGMTLMFGVLGCFAVDSIGSMELFMTMAAGVVTCCFSLKEIRTRMKLIEVTTLASVAVMISAAAMATLKELPGMTILYRAGSAAAITVAVGIVIQGFLPIIERVFGVVTSMTLLDYSDANQPLLKKLAMQAPGTYSHSLLIGSIAEAAADAIGANGLLCRVGAYYHDIGKINKPPYFAENEMGSASMHKQLSPAMSQLVIVGHVKNGIEIAKEYGLPGPIRQFIETHHGTTLIEYFYDQAKKRESEKGGKVSESEFRYPGPKPQTREAAIGMLADTCESAARSINDPTPTKIETIVHNMAMKRLQDGQFDECDLTLRELSKIESALAKSLAAHHHGRVAYPKSPDRPHDEKEDENAVGQLAEENENIDQNEDQPSRTG